MIPAIHQFVPVLEPGAVGTHVLRLRDVIRRRLGVDSEVFALEIRADMEARDPAGYNKRARRDDILVYHLAIGSRLAEIVGKRHEPLIVDHHGITPPEWFEHWDPGTAVGCEAGLRELRSLAPRAFLGIAHSQFTRADLDRFGFARSEVAPVLADFEGLGADPDASVLGRLHDAKRGGGADWLFVGRIAPHKCQADVVKALAVYRRLYDPRARLHLVGSSSSSLYDTALRRFVEALGLHDAVSITGAVPNDALAAYLASADVFVVLSEHEGFGVPLLEAWHQGVPVVAYRAAAIPETLGGAGVLLNHKRPATVAAAVARVLDDSDLRGRLRELGRARLVEVTADSADARWAELLGGLS